MDPLELWGGYECTVNRIGDKWHDQTLRSGHEHRIGDLQLFADLGFRSLRYPALWERMSPSDPEFVDFGWTDERLSEIGRIGMNPILTLCHHGSGPHYTSLIDGGFAPGLARHAAAVAKRYPWVRDWTPVNEPLTTARFSALYGYWYPHTKDEALFWTALLNEIDATRLAMREIRAVNPDARLIQTDDLGFCHATDPLQREADFQNARRWMGWDLLCGRVVPGHALWDRLAGFGLEDRLLSIAADPCPPDVIGINHYLSSERLLDHRVNRYPDRSLADRETGDCGGINYVDIDAIRNRRDGVLGVPALLQQAWDRYRIPIAVTECHNGATREEQVRWFVEVWNGVIELRRGGVDIRSVTAWSLLGSHDWNRMVTRFAGHYETGVFDVRSGTPRPTLLATVLKDLAQGREPSAPVLSFPGWWRRESRFLGAVPNTVPELEIVSPEANASSPLMIVGDEGALTQAAIYACEARGLHYVRCGYGLDSPGRFDEVAPLAVLDAREISGLCVADTSRDDRDGPLDFPEVWSRHDLPSAVITGLSSRSCETPGLLQIRTGAIYMPWDRTAHAVRILDALDRGEPVHVNAAASWDSVYGPDLIDTTLDLLLDGVSGEVTLVPDERASEAEFARALAVVADRDPGLVVEIGTAAGSQLNAPSMAASFLPHGETTLERFVRESRAARRAAHVTPSSRERCPPEAAE